MSLDIWLWKLYRHVLELTEWTILVRGLAENRFSPVVWSLHSRQLRVMLILALVKRWQSINYRIIFLWWSHHLQFLTNSLILFHFQQKWIVITIESIVRLLHWIKVLEINLMWGCYVLWFIVILIQTERTLKLILAMISYLLLLLRRVRFVRYYLNILSFLIKNISLICCMDFNRWVIIF